MANEGVQDNSPPSTSSLPTYDQDSMFPVGSIFQETFKKLTVGNGTSVVYSDDYDENDIVPNFTGKGLQDLPSDMQFNEAHMIAIIVYTVLMIFSAIGNISVLATILRLRRRQGRLTRINLLLSHLATADLLVTFLMMPMEIAWNATVSWFGGDILCRLLSVTRIFGLYLSGFLLMCISLDRYYAVVHPLSITQSRQRCRIMLATAWLFSALCSLPQAIIFHVESHPTFTWYQQCVTFHSFPSPTYELVYNFFGFAFLYGVPLVTIATFYLRILWEICRINSRRSGQDQLRRSTIGAFGRAKVRTLKMTVLIVATFSILWAPYNVMCLWYWVDPKSASKVDQRIQKSLFLFACTNSCMNPLIYGLFHFRRPTQPSRAAVATGGGGLATCFALQQRSYGVGSAEENGSTGGLPTTSMAMSSL